MPKILVLTKAIRVPPPDGSPSGDGFDMGRKNSTVTDLVAICLHAIQRNDVSLRRVLLFPLQNREPKEDGVRNAKVNNSTRE